MLYNLGMYYLVSMVGDIGRWSGELTYTADEPLERGLIVEVPVGETKTRLGVVLKPVTDPPLTDAKGRKINYKPICRVVYSQPLPTALVDLQQWLRDYYAVNGGAAWQTMLPTRLNRKRIKPYTEPAPQPLTTPPLNAAQQAAVQQILAQTGTSLLHGITGSGKTNVYKAVAQATLQRGQSVIILVPEIALTAQLVAEFRQTFPHVVTVHSALTAAEKVIIWHYILTATEPLVVVGPRSALFMPVQHLGLIVVDECHEPSYKQDSAPRYLTSTVASQLRQLTGARLILGSATPSITDYYLAQHFQRPIIELNQLARPGAVPPTVQIVDMTRRDNFHTESRLLSTPLINAMCQARDAHRQVLLFHNRRGTASTTMCQDCGWVALCPRCYLPLTLHHDLFRLRCHLCGYATKPFLKCPECQSIDIRNKGIGTKRIEEEVHKLFKSATVARFDGDTAAGAQVQDRYADLHDGNIDIIIGTQTIAKGLDLPKLGVVGVVQADAGLNLPDFGAHERTFQLIAQVCGRVGRTADPTTAIIQTYQPTAPAVTFGAKQDYAGFYAAEIQARERGHFPPFAYLLKLTCTYKTERGAAGASSRLANHLRTAYRDQVAVLGPAPSFYERLGGQYTWQIVVRAPRRTTLQQILSELPLGWHAELDPLSLL